MAVTATQAYRIWDSVRIKRVEMWCAVDPTTGSPVSPAIEFPGNSGSGMKYSDTALGFTDIAHVSASPPQSSLAWDWLPSGATTTICELNVPKNTVVDMILDVTFADIEAPPVVGVVGAVPSLIYMRALDNNGSGYLVPIGYLTI